VRDNSNISYHFQFHSMQRYYPAGGIIKICLWVKVELSRFSASGGKKSLDPECKA
jgi:hypothetical protein